MNIHQVQVPGPLWLLILFMLHVFPGVVDGREFDCTQCHEVAATPAGAHEHVDCQDCHGEIEVPHRSAKEPGASQSLTCSQCHRKPDREVSRSIHGDAVSCTDCHGGAHDVRHADDLRSETSPVNQIKRCGGCHDEPPTLIGSYLASVHGRALLVSGLINAPSCSDCHGGHRILGVSVDRASTSRSNGPQTCGECHALLLDDWVRLSAHGKAWKNGEPGPRCTTCHSSHEIEDPRSREARLTSAENCGSCHTEYLMSFRDSFHGKANSLGFVQGATCSDCHTPHKNSSASDPRSSVHPDNLEKTCGQCHGKATASFVTFDPHNDPSDATDSYPVYLVWLFMTALLIGVFAFFGIHDLLWLQRSLVGVMRGEYKFDAGKDDRYVRRFSAVNVKMHLAIVITFLLLAATGLPLKFHWAPWARELMDLLGGVDTARVLHRLAAIGTFGYAAFHIGHLFVRRVFGRERGLFWGPDSMVPQPKDFTDFFASVRYFFYLGKRPAADRWTYFEKFDYFAVFWGVLIIGVSGSMLWFPEFFTAFLPGWALNAAYVVHSDEALLATGFIFIFHFFHTHLRPESFPMDIVVFTGKMPLSHFQVTRPVEYQRLVAKGELEEYLVEAPSTKEIRRAYMFGSLALIIGVTLAVGIIWALLTH